MEEEADGPLSLIYMSALVPTLMCVGLVLLILAVASYYVHNYFMGPGVVPKRGQGRDSKSLPKTQPRKKKPKKH